MAVVGVCLAAGCGPRVHPKYEPSPEELEWEECHLEEKSDPAGGIACYEHLCGLEPPRVRACYDRARALFDMGEIERGREAALEFAAGFPDDGLAPVAVKRLARSYDKRGEPEEGAAALVDLASRVEETDVHDSVVYRTAELQRRAGDVEAEAATLERLIAAYERWDSQLWDDGIWRLIAIREEQGDVAAEEELLDQLLDTRESSWFLGSYTSPYHDDALHRLGRLAFEQGDLARAKDLFGELADIETSRMRDDATLALAEVRLAQGKREKACKLLAKIIDEMPAANSRRKAAKLAEEQGCR